MAKAEAVERAHGTGKRPVACPRCEEFNPWGATTCRSCGLSLADQSLADRYTQAPWQLVLLSVLTFSLYDLYWFNRTWRMIGDLAAPAASKERPALLTLGLLVPGLNCYLVYRLFRTIRNLTLPTDTELGGGSPDTTAVTTEPIEPAALAVLYVGLMLCWVLPTPWWWIASRLAVWPLMIVQLQVNRYVATSMPDVHGARQFAWLELVLLAVGLFFTLLVLNSTYNCALCIPTLDNS